MERLTADKVKRTAKDSVFTHLFSQPEYAFQMYRTLFPDDATVEPENIQIVTLHEAEVMRLMARVFETVDTTAMNIRTYGMKISVLTLVRIGMTDEQIVAEAAKMNNIGEDYAQNILDYVKEHPDPEEW